MNPAALRYTHKMTTQHADGALWGALCADAYALGAHWIYENDVIAAAPLKWEGFNDPITAYHEGKHAGDFTHYGDRMLWLLEGVATRHGFEQERYAQLWREKMRDYRGYIDGASRQMMARIDGDQNAGVSTDLAGAGGFAPLLLCCGDSLEALLIAVEALSRLTHGDETVVRTARYFAECAYRLMAGNAMEPTLFEVAEKHGGDLRDIVMAGIDSRDEPTEETIARFGKSCSVDGMAGVIHLLIVYADDYRGAIAANVRSGGDSAARGLIVGTLLGASLGIEAIPASWIASLHAGERISEMMQKLRVKA